MVVALHFLFGQDANIQDEASVVFNRAKQVRHQENVKKTSGKGGKCEKEEKQEKSGEFAAKVGEDQDEEKTNGRRGGERE